MRENATKAEKGAYVCEASNSAGSDSYMVEVKIIPLKGIYRITIRSLCDELRRPFLVN